MKILIIHTHYLEIGGEDQVVSSEVSLLKEHGHEVIIYEKTNEYIENLSFLKKFLYILFDLNFSRTVYREIKEIIKKENPDIAHIHNIFYCVTPSVYFALKEEGIPIVQSLHNYRLFCLRGTFYNKGEVCEKCRDKMLFKGVLERCWRNSLFSSFFLAKILHNKTFLKNIDSFIVTSNFSKNKFIELGLDPSKLHLKTNFLSSNFEENIEDKKYALFLGRLVDYKGVETLMKAFGGHPALKLKIIGDGPLRERMEDFSQKHENVEWLGRVKREKVIEAIKNCSFLVFPSECYENMPLVIMESFVFSKPVLASNLGAIKEFVIDGINGILFNPGDPDDLARRASYLFSHDQELLQMGRNARQSFKDRFTRESNYEKLIAIYTKTIEMSRSEKRPLVITYSLADQNFNQTKSVGVFNVSTQLFENLSLRDSASRLNLLINSTLEGRLRLSSKAITLRHDAAGSRLGRLLWDQWGVYAAARKNASHWLFLPKGFTSFLKPRGFKLAVYIHDAMHDFYRTNYRGAMPWFETIYFIECLKKTLRYSDVIFTNTDFTQSELRRLANNFGIELPLTITAGIGFNRPKNLGLKKKNSILVLTSSWPHKLTARAIDFMGRWQRETGFSGKVELVGSLPEGLGITRFANWQHHQRLSEQIFRQFLAEANVLLFFSKYEGFGMPPVEAMIVGTCPVYSDIPVTREVMEGRGFPFNNDSYEGFARAMNNALKENAGQIEQWADELLDRHNWDKVVKRVSRGLLEASRK